MSTATDALQRAIDYLHATEVAPGRYAWRYEERGCYRVVGEEMMEALGYGLIDHIAPHDTCYVVWAAQVAAVDMSEWWSPARRYCVVSPNGDHSVGIIGLLGDLVTGYHYVTANLDTGEEVEA